MISPGSRNAPLTIGFSQETALNCYSIVDERCAAFFAIGIAQQLREPVAVVCTSGSALLNYYPAITEAFYSNYPLVVISADRPEHLIDIGDGQTIRQKNVFVNHSLFNANLSSGENSFQLDKNEVLRALQTALTKSGPVHINVPFDEPLYKRTEKPLLENLSLLPVRDKVSLKKTSLEKLGKIYNGAEKILVLVGANYPDKKLQAQLEQLVHDPRFLVLTETTSNLHHPHFINSIDKLIYSLSDKDFNALRPDLLITLGGMVVSKKIKKFLRKYPPENHWHIDSYTQLDTFHCLSEYISLHPVTFFDKFLDFVVPRNGNYQENWLDKMEEKRQRHNAFLKNVDFSDLLVFGILLKALPDNCQLQLGNSSVIRYAQLFDNKPSISVFCNRGTSGIDGSTSTAIGAAAVNKRPTVFITGDLSFFYDSNGLWNEYIPSSFRIIVINNGGGGIFKILPGPALTDALPFFTTPHKLNATHLCKMHGIDYCSAADQPSLETELETFFSESSVPKLMEIFTPASLNDKVLKDYFEALA